MRAVEDSLGLSIYIDRRGKKRPPMWAVVSIIYRGEVCYATAGAAAVATSGTGTGTVSSSVTLSR
jgi:hypothetical protein